MLEVKDIFNYLPHRYPFLLVDRVSNIEVGKSIKAYKNITYNEPQFTGHFPNIPIFPGVMILEAMAQCTGILAFHTMNEMPNNKYMYYLAGVDKCRFKKPVIPGDRIDFSISIITNKRNIWKFNASAAVDDKEVASAEIICAKVAVE